MTTPPPFTGIYANLPTAYGTDLAFSAAGTRRAVERVVDGGISGITCLLSTGDFAFLTDDERHAVAETVVEAADGRVPVVVGVAAFSTAQAVRFAAHAARIGADGVMVLAMPYGPLDESGVLAHYGAVAEASGLPVGVYENSVFAAPLLAPSTYARLRDSCNVQFAKNGTGQVDRVRAILDECGPDLRILDGSGSQMLHALDLGAAGWCTAFASVFPRQCAQVYSSWAAGDTAAATTLFAGLAPTIDFYARNGFGRTLKAGMAIEQLDQGGVRAPMVALAEPQVEALRGLHQQVRALGVEG